MPHLLVPPFGSFDYNALFPLGIVAITPLLVLLADLVMPSGEPRRGIAVGISVAGLLAATYVLIAAISLASIRSGVRLRIRAGRILDRL